MIVLAQHHNFPEHDAIHAEFPAESGKLRDMADILAGQRAVHVDGGTSPQLSCLLTKPYNVISDGAKIGLAAQPAHHLDLSTVETDLQISKLCQRLEPFVTQDASEVGDQMTIDF